jgi:hypothetical protein
MSDRRCPFRLGLLAAAAVVVAGCGTVKSSGGSVTSGRSAAVSATATTSAAPAPAPPPPHLRIVTPHRGLKARDGTIVVRVAVLGGRGHPRLRYVVDGRRSRRGADRFVIHDLSPGRHRLVVMLSADSAVHASTVFAVRKPPPPPPPPVTSVPPTMNAPAPMTTPAAPRAMGIPQNGGGDGDGDNSGGPSDGDGQI